MVLTIKNPFLGDRQHSLDIISVCCGRLLPGVITVLYLMFHKYNKFEPRHEISNNVAF